jgi:uncharacterized protein (DUF983 family)
MVADDLPAPLPRTTTMWRGFRLRCPRCGKGTIFRAFLKVSDQCGQCGEPLGEIRADDLPAYLTILVVGHIVVPGLLWAESYDFSTVAELAVAVPLALGLIALLLPRFKGAAIGLLWSLDREKKAAAQ